MITRTSPVLCAKDSSQLRVWQWLAHVLRVLSVQAARKSKPDWRKSSVKQAWQIYHAAAERLILLLTSFRSRHWMIWDSSVKTKDVKRGSLQVRSWGITLSCAKRGNHSPTSHLVAPYARDRSLNLSTITVETTSIDTAVSTAPCSQESHLIGL